MRLRTYQREAVHHLARGRKRFLFDDMGLGKTVVALVSAWHTRATCVIVVSPPGVRDVWIEQSRVWSTFTPKIVTGPGEIQWPVPGELRAMSYNQLGLCVSHATKTIKPEKKRDANGKRVPQEVRERKYRQKLARNQVWTKACRRLQGPPPPGVVVIFDEAHWLKSTKTHAHHGAKAMRMLVETYGGKVYALTGTPAPHSPLDYWGLVEVMGVERETWGTFDRFVKHFDGKQIKWLAPKEERRRLASQFGQIYEVGDEGNSSKPAMYTRALASLERKLAARKLGVGGQSWKWAKVPPGGPIWPVFGSLALRREKSLALPDLPAKQYSIRTVRCKQYRGETGRALKKAAKLIGNRVGKRVISELDPSEVVAILDEVNEAEHLASCLKALAISKIPALFELVEEHEAACEPLIVASAYRDPIEELAKRKGWGAIAGSFSRKQREHSKQAFRAGKLHGLAITQQAAGEGLTLVHHGDRTCCRMAFVSRTWSAAVEAQTEDRISRFGQTCATTYIDIVVDHPLEWAVHRALARKATVSRVALEL